jgi:hypothetical protein
MRKRKELINLVLGNINTHGFVSVYVCGLKNTYVSYTDIRIINLLRHFIFVAFAPTYFGLESQPSSESYEPFRRIQRNWHLMHTHAADYINQCHFIVKLQR